jgi:DNA polymerase-3 subunit alpha
MLLPRAYSHHSLLSAVPKIPALIADAKAKGYTTVALTDEETGSGLIEFYQACLKNEIKPVLGVTLKIPNLADSSGVFGRHDKFSKVALLAKNEQGYKSLLKLISLARTVQEVPAYHITHRNLSDLGEKLQCFVLLCGNDHELVANLRQGRKHRAEQILEAYIRSVGTSNLLVELAYPLANDNKEFIKQLNLELVDICQSKKVRMLASPAPRYLSTADQEVFRTVLAIRDNKRIGEVKLTRDFMLPSSKELAQIFDYIPGLTDTTEIENQIDIQIRTDYDSKASEAFFPLFDLEAGQNAIDRLTWETYIGLLERFAPEGKTRQEWKEVFPYARLTELKTFAASIIPDTNRLKGYPEDYWQKKRTIKDYIDRIEKELDIIAQKGYPTYFLVFSDIMQFCRENGIVINTRGSAAGCLVGYFTGINILDSLLYDIPFERFLNPFRPSAPDIDGDFADDKRGKVIEYIKNKYGQDKVCQIITFGTMLPRAAVRDVGRALGVSYKKCDRLSKLIPTAPPGRKTTFAWAFETSQELKEVYERDEESQRIISIAQKIEGNYRHASSHAAGVIISPTVMTDYTPLQWDSEHEMIISQYDMKTCEKIGLVKIDILGIRNLAILGNAVELAQRRKQIKIDLLNIDLQNKKAFDLLAKGRTMGIFQLSGTAPTRYLVELEPTKVQDLMAMVALYRPGPMVNIPEYIARKKNPKKVKYYLPQMKEWMEPSYGILVYQDDVLYTAIYIAGYDWGEVDTLRKGMGKKIKEVIDSQHIKFVEGAQKHSGLSKEQAEEIWNLVVPFSAYGFNKAHSSSYGMVAYWTAYMKAEYPAEFMTALMTAENSNLDKIAAAIKECQELGLQILPPDINKSHEGFWIENDTTIRYGLSSVKNLGSDIIRFLIEEREKNGLFTSIEDFLERMSSCPGFNKRSLEALIWAGCLDEVGSEVLEKVRSRVRGTNP